MQHVMVSVHACLQKVVVQFFLVVEQKDASVSAFNRKLNLETIRSTNEISEFFSTGKRFSNRFVTFIVHRLPEDNDSDHFEHDPRGRVAFIAGKKHGNAVWRNSAKRRLREICRMNKEVLNQNDILFIAKPTIMNSDFHEVEEVCRRTLNKIISGKRKETTIS